MQELLVLADEHARVLGRLRPLAQHRHDLARPAHRLVVADAGEIAPRRLRQRADRYVVAAGADHADLPMPISRFVDHAAGQRTRVPAELGDHGAGLIAHSDVVDAAALAALALLRLREETHAEPARRHVGDRAVLRHRGMTMRVARKGEGRVRQRENVAAVAGAVAVEHPLDNRHAEPRRNLGEPPGSPCPGPGWPCRRAHIASALRRATSAASRAMPQAFRPVYFGARFSRNAMMPSRASGEAPARRCRSRSRSSCWASVLVDDTANACLASARP